MVRDPFVAVISVQHLESERRKSFATEKDVVYLALGV
jgi:hypothetical protein